MTYVPDALPDNLTGAIWAYTGAGWYLAPIKPGTKNPGAVLGKGWQTKTSNDPEVVDQYVTGTSNGLALHCGRSDLIGLDVDRTEDCDDRFRADVLDNPAVPFQSTRDNDPQRGHYLFQVPPGRRFGNPNIAGGEVRGNNGVILLDPTVHPKAAEGGRYLWKRTGPIPMLPQWLAEQLPDVATTDDTVSDAEVTAWLQAHADKLPGQRPGRFAAILRKYLAAVNGAPGRGLPMLAAPRKSRHASLCDALIWACREINAGQYDSGVLKELYAAHRKALDDPTHPNGAVPKRNDWAGCLSWAIAQAATRPAIDGLNPPPGGPPRTVEELMTGKRAAPAGSGSPDTVHAQVPQLSTTVTAPTWQKTADQEPNPRLVNMHDQPDPLARKRQDPQEPPVTNAEPAKVIPIRRVRVPDYAEDFWERRPEFGIIRDWARQRMVSPWAVFGVVLARVAMTIPPTVKIPPMIASAASLNHYVGIVGPSSTGKSAASSVAAEAVDLSQATTLEPDGDLYLYPVGSGEGLVDQFGHTEHPMNPDTGKPDKSKPQVYIADRAAVLLEADEIDSLLAQTGRSASTITGQIKTAWTATKTLGFGYRGNGTRPPAHSYRFCVVVAIVPGMGAGLLAMAPGGFPQRFTYMPAGDPLCQIPTSDVDPPRWVLQPQKWPAWKPMLLNFPREAWEEIQQHRQSEAVQAAAWERPTTQQEQGHLLLAKAKVAANIAVLNNRQHPTSEDWELAGIYMRVSGDTYQALLDYIEQDGEKGDVAKGISQGITADVAETVVTERKTNRVIAKLVEKLGDEWVSGSHIRKTMTSADRGALPDALTALLGTGQIESRPVVGNGGSKGVEYRKAATR